MSTLPALEVKDKHLNEKFEQLFREYAPFVYRTAFGVTGNVADAEDALQTIFSRLLRRPWAENLRKNPKAYLYRSAVNASLDVIRSRRSRTENFDANAHEIPAPTDDAALDPEVRERLLAALDNLAKSDPRNAELLILRYFHNLSDAKIAETMGKSRGSIALRLHRARGRLKKLLGPIWGDKL